MAVLTRKVIAQRICERCDTRFSLFFVRELDWRTEAWHESAGSTESRFDRYVDAWAEWERIRDCSCIPVREPV